MGSSLIYVAIIAMWAGLLVPMWLRRHEQETEVRSVDRFSTAMRILSRRTPPPPDRRYLVMPQRPPSATRPVADVPRREPAPRVAPAARRPAPARAAARRPVSGRSRLIARRRRILLGLFAVALVLLVLAVVGVVSWWWQGVADLALVAYVAHLRSEAKRAAELGARRRRTHPERAAAPAAEFRETVDVPATGRSAALQPPAAREMAAPLVVDDETWEPVPVPLPTYVTAPVAPPPAAPEPVFDDDEEFVAVRGEQPAPQTIDLTRPGRWSEAHSREPLFDQEADDDFAVFDDDSLEQIVERRRAVND